MPLGLCALAFGCGSSVVVDGRTTDAAAAVADAPATRDAATVGALVACHSLGNRASLVAEAEVAADPPAPRGGAILDGVYELTATTRWRGVTGLPGPAGRPARTTLSLRSGRYESISTDARGEEFRHAGTFEARATLWRLFVDCPVSTTSDFQYTAHDDVFTVFLTTDGATVTSVYTRR
ncbi:MAG: hypothetical protein JWM10_4783 [Myxococcaceae bacterium]|nr:hypothetical protein [Myxococcaceae bacterium]